MATRADIMDNAHKEESSNWAREYFKESGIVFSNIGIEDCKKLRFFINEICFKLCDDKNYSMIKDLEVKRRTRSDKWGIYLKADGSYFKNREAISFWTPDEKLNDLDFPVGFCAWASGCNRIPFIQGFIKWCDWMKEKYANEVDNGE